MVELYVDQIMSRPVETVTPDTSIGDAAGEVLRHDVGALVVVDEENRIEGLLTATDFVRIVRDETASAESTVAEFARTDVLAAERRDPVKDVVDGMLEHRIHHVPVVDGDEVVGMLSAMDLAAYLSRSLES